MLNTNLQRARDGFAAQFTVEDGRLVFRKSRRGPAVALSETERDNLIRQFTRRMSWLVYGGGLASVFVVLLGLAALIMADIDPPPIAITLAACLPSVLLVLAVFWAWNEPSRRLAGRAVTGQALSKDEARRRGLDRLKWAQLLTALGGVAIIAVRIKWNRNLLSGDNLFYVALAGALLVLVAVQAVRKLRREQQRKAETTIVGS